MPSFFAEDLRSIRAGKGFVQKPRKASNGKAKALLPNYAKLLKSRAMGTCQFCVLPGT